LNQVTTKAVAHILDKLAIVHGYLREILTDGGNVFGLKSKHSKFDRWCKKREIKHIRTAINDPTIQGKFERFFQTFKREFRGCNGE
jgi:transposase InsO family protein